MASTRLSVLIPTPRRTPRQRLLLWAAAGASLAALPWVAPLLTWLHQAPLWVPLARTLAASPMAAWVLMLVWGLAIPLCVLAALWGHQRMRAAGTTVGAVLLASVWWIHMPAMQQCSAVYELDNGCRLLQSAFLLVASVALVACVFALLVLALRSMGWLALPPAEDDALDRHRYGA